MIKQLHIFFFDSDPNKDDTLEESDTTYLTLVANLNSITNSTDDIKDLFDLCIKSKHTKIIRHKKMTLTTHKLQEIYPDL